MGPTPSIFQHCPREALTRQSCGNPVLRGHPQAPRVALCPLSCHQFLSTTCRLRTFHGSFTVTVLSSILHQFCPFYLFGFLSHPSSRGSQSSSLPEPRDPSFFHLQTFVCISLGSIICSSWPNVSPPVRTSTRRPLQDDAFLDVPSNGRALLPALNLQGEMHELYSMKITSHPLLSFLGRNRITGVNGRNSGVRTPWLCPPVFPFTMIETMAKFQLPASAFLIYAVAV